MKTPSARIRAMMASSMALPGMQELLAAEAPEEGLNYQFTHYDESPVPQSRLQEGDPSRYEINSHQLRWVRNLDSSYTLTVGYLHEAMSGSSPWFVVPDSAGRSLQVMSGATIREKRDQLDVSLSRRQGEYTHTLGVGHSTEDDYRAWYGSYSGKKENAETLATYSWGVSLSSDDIEPTDALEFGRIESASRDSWSVSLGYSQILNKNAVFQTGAALTSHSGFLSDPYKMVLVGGFLLADQRPDDRVQFAWTNRLRHYLTISGAALQADYRYFRDSWDIQAHTLDLAWVQPLASGWELTPAVRYHSQTSADFYAPFFNDSPDDPWWSSDFRLATFGALSYRLNLGWRQETYRLNAGIEYYDSSGHLALSGTPEDTPGLVDFWRANLSFTINR